jgi:hypothetical protein
MEIINYETNIFSNDNDPNVKYNLLFYLRRGDTSKYFYNGDELNILFDGDKNFTRFTIDKIFENSITTTTGEELYLEDILWTTLKSRNGYGGKRRTKGRTKRRTKRKNRKTDSIG